MNLVQTVFMKEKSEAPRRKLRGILMNYILGTLQAEIHRSKLRGISALYHSLAVGRDLPTG